MITYLQCKRCPEDQIGSPGINVLIIKFGGLSSFVLNQHQDSHNSLPQKDLLHLPEH